MQIIIEGYQYPAGSVDKVLWEGAFQTVDGKVSIGYVGYYWNDRLKDSVFVLPKVFLEPDVNKQDLVFGKYKPEDVIDVAKKKFTKAERDFIYGFAVWIYRTLSVFKAANPKSDIILHEYVSQMGRGRSHVSAPRRHLSCILCISWLVPRGGFAAPRGYTGRGGYGIMYA